MVGLQACKEGTKEGRNKIIINSRQKSKIKSLELTEQMSVARIFMSRLKSSNLRAGSQLKISTFNVCLLFLLAGFLKVKVNVNFTFGWLALGERESPHTEF